MQRFSIEQKYQACRIIMIAFLVIALYCLQELSPFASAHHNLVWLFAFMTAIISAIIFCVGFYYYRNKRDDTQVDAIAMQTLNDYGKHPHEESK